MIQLLIADDHLLFRSMLEEMLKRDEDFQIVASCADGYEAVACCQRLNPDIALLDIGMPGKGGIEALKEIKETCPQIKAVMLTTFEDDENIKEAVQLGADGYLIKDMTPETLMMSIKCIYNNMVLFHKGAYSLLQSSLSIAYGAKNNKVQIHDMVFDTIDVRIMQLIVKGKSNRDIGTALNYSEGTIKNRISKILATAGVSDRTELCVFAIKHEIV